MITKNEIFEFDVNSLNQLLLDQSLEEDLKKYCLPQCYRSTELFGFASKVKYNEEKAKEIRMTINHVYEGITWMLRDARTKMVYDQVDRGSKIYTAALFETIRKAIKLVDKNKFIREMNDLIYNGSSFNGIFNVRGVDIITIDLDVINNYLNRSGLDIIKKFGKGLVGAFFQTLGFYFSISVFSSGFNFLLAPVLPSNIVTSIQGVIMKIMSNRFSVLIGFAAFQSAKALVDAFVENTSLLYLRSDIAKTFKMNNPKFGRLKFKLTTQYPLKTLLNDITNYKISSGKITFQITPLFRVKNGINPNKPIVNNVKNNNLEEDEIVIETFNDPDVEMSQIK